MSEKIVVPVLGESITEATVSKWLKNEGDVVEADEPIVELETDKVNLEVPSPVSGVLSKINSKDGSTVEVGALLGLVSNNGASENKKEIIEKIEPSSNEDNVVNLEVAEKELKVFDKTTDQVPKDEEPLILTNEIEDEKTLDIKTKKEDMSPAVRKIVTENNRYAINRGTGKDGRILREI